MFDALRQKAFQKKIKDDERTAEVKNLLMQLVSEGNKIDGILVAFLEHGKIQVMEAGLQDDFEAQVLIERAKYLINRDGLVR